MLQQKAKQIFKEKEIQTLSRMNFNTLWRDCKETGIELASSKLTERCVKELTSNSSVGK